MRKFVMMIVAASGLLMQSCDSNVQREEADGIEQDTLTGIIKPVHEEGV